MDDASRIEAGRRCFEIRTSILEKHDDVYASLACVARLLAHGAPAIVDEIAKTLEELRQHDPKELIDLLPVTIMHTVEQRRRNRYGTLTQT